MMDDSKYGFDELRDLVAARHEGVELVYLPILERCLQASVTFPVGAIIVRETPFAVGRVNGSHAREVLRDSVAAFDDDMEEAVFIDCICSMLLRYTSESDNETRKEMATLCRTATSVNLDTAAEFHSWLREEFQKCISLDMLSNLINLARSNNFHASRDMNILFVGSMFEHSCAPNIFAGDVGDMTQRNFRTLRDIAPGDRLSIDYLMFPRTYWPTAHRRTELLTWGFHCECVRCENPEERVRCFACPTCGGEVHAGIWRCTCGFVADDAVIKRYAEAETRVEEELNSGQTWRHVTASPSLVHKFHYLVFHDAWAERACFEDQGPPKDVLLYLLDAISWFHADANGLHPEMIHVAHELAERERDLDEQHKYLAIESRCLSVFFPEAQKQADEEIWKLLGMRQCPPPPELVTSVGTQDAPSAPHAAPPIPSATTDGAATGFTSTMCKTAALKCASSVPFVPASRVPAPSRSVSGGRPHCASENAFTEGTRSEGGREALLPGMMLRPVMQLEEMD